VTLAETLFLKQPWLITPEALHAVATSAKAFFGSSAPLPSEPKSDLLTLEDGVGIITLEGPLIRKPDILARVLFRATDTEAAIAGVREASLRDDVEAVFLDIDSPGGTAGGTPELAQAVADLSAVKPVYAFTSGLMCSAAYWVGSQANAVYATPSARVGSIGVLLPVVDSTGAFEQAGLKVEVFAAGKFKSAGTPGVALTDEQRGQIQTDVEQLWTEFRDAVLVRGRKIPADAMEGQAFTGRQAQRFNLAGLVRDRADAMARLRQYHVATQGSQTRRVDMAPRAMTLEDQLAEALARVQMLETEAQTGQAALVAAQTELHDLRTQFTTLTAERDQSLADLATARQSLDGVMARNTDLEAAEKDVELRASRRAAEIVAATGTRAPEPITPAGDQRADDIVARFQAITDPSEQTLYWRQLNAQQKAHILNHTQG
jgi:signal peptide peptidase SppA